MRTSARAAFAGVAALAALLATVPLTGCGGGGSKGGGSASAVSRAKGAVTMTVVWPERTRLIPDASDRIVVTLTRTPDDNLPTPFTTQLIFDRPAAAPFVVQKKTDQLPTGTYSATATAYPKVTGDGTPNAATGANVAQATKAVGNVLVESDKTTSLTLTMQTTIDKLVASVPATFEVATDKKNRIRPGETVQLSVDAFDATPDTATPPGPYRVLLTPSKVTYKSSDPSVATVSATGLVTARTTLANTTTARTVTITITDTNSADNAADYKTTTIDITVVPVGLSQAAQWAKFHADLSNTGQAPAAYPNVSNANLTTYATGSKFALSSAAIAEDGTAYIGTNVKDGGSDADNRLYALDPVSKQPKWVFPAGGAIDSAPLIGQDGTIYFGTTSGDFYALQDNGTASGDNLGYTILWQRKLNAPIQASPTIDRYGTLYVATIESGNADAGNKLYALNGITGGDIKAPITGQPNRIWTFKANGGIFGTPVISEDGARIYIASRTTDSSSSDSNIYIINTGIPTRPGVSYTNGAIVARAPLTVSGSIATGMILANIGGKATLFAAAGNTLIALDAISGGPIRIGSQDWVYDASATIGGTPALSSDTNTIYLATLDDNSGNFDHKVVAINTATATEIWRTQQFDTAGNAYFKFGFTSSPALSGDGSQLYIGGRDGSIYAFDTADNGLPHEPVWVQTTPDAGAGQPNIFESSPALGNQGSLILGGFDGTIYVLQ